MSARIKKVPAKKPVAKAAARPPKPKDRAYVLPLADKNGEMHVLVKIIKEEPKVPDGKIYYTYSLLGGCCNLGQMPEDTVRRQASEESVGVVALTVDPVKGKKLAKIHTSPNKKGGTNVYYTYPVMGADTYEADYLHEKYRAYAEQQDPKGRFQYLDTKMAARKGLPPVQYREHNKLKEHGANCMEADFLVWVPVSHLKSLATTDGSGFKWRKYTHIISSDTKDMYTEYMTVKGQPDTVEQVWETDMPAILKLP